MQHIIVKFLFLFSLLISLGQASQNIEKGIELEKEPKKHLTTLHSLENVIENIPEEKLKDALDQHTAAIWGEREAQFKEGWDAFQKAKYSNDNELINSAITWFSKAADQGHEISGLILEQLSNGIEDNFTIQQEQWKNYHESAQDLILQSSDYNVSPSLQFSRLHLSTMPHPALYHLYIRDPAGETYCLVRDAKASTARFVRLYGAADKPFANYTTVSLPSTNMPKEIFVNPRDRKDLYKGSRKYPTIASTSYPTGVRTYYVLVNGKKIRLDRGHGVPHADTLGHNGTISSQDSENYTPQNLKYNSPIRRDLEEDLGQQKLTYKEISIYHNDFMYDVTARVNAKDKNYRIPIPEGFLFLTFTANGEVKDSYYFPNLVDYEELKGNQPDYKHFPSLYRIPNLSSWFLIPEVTLGLTEEHQHKTDLAQLLVKKLLLFAPTFFSKFSEGQMPPKARVALLTTLLEWNMETAATLEFLSFENQLQLAHFYLNNRRNFWEFDDRYEAEKQLSLKQFLNDKSVSHEAHTLVKFLATHLNFLGLQDKLQEISTNFQEVYKSAPFYWEMPEHYPKIVTLSAGNGETYDYNIAKISPQDISKLKKVIGGISNHSTPRAKYILSIIDARARKTASSIVEKLNIMRLYYDNKELWDSEKYLYWEKAILEQVKKGEDITLLSLRKITDYYAYRGMDAEKSFWFQQIIRHIQNNPSYENFIAIADWCLSGRATFLQNLEEQVDNLRPANMLALQIYKGLSYIDPHRYQERFKEIIQAIQVGFGLDRSDYFGISRANIVSLDSLEHLISGDTGLRIKQLSYLFLQTICSTDLERLTPYIPKNNFEELLNPKSSDLKHQAMIYHKLGFTKEAQESALACFKLAKNSLAFKDSTLLLKRIGDNDLARVVAKQALKKAQDYNDYIYAAEAFHEVGDEALKQEAKKLCFNSIKNDVSDELIAGNFISAAITLYHSGLIDFAKEASDISYNMARNSLDLWGTVQVFYQNDMHDFALDAAKYAFEIAKDKTDRDYVDKSFKYLKQPSPYNAKRN